MAQYITPGALSAYSAFLVALLGAELEGLSRGVVYSALKRAAIVSPQRAGLQSKAEGLCARQFSQQELGNGYMKCEICHTRHGGEGSEFVLS